MNRRTARILLLLSLALLVPIAGCSSGDSGAVSPDNESDGTTPEPDVDSGSSDDADGSTANETDSSESDDPTDNETDTDQEEQQPSLYEAHRTGLEEAGSFTVTFIFPYSEVTGPDGESYLAGTENYTTKRIIATNESLGVYPENAAAYRPPNADISYANLQGRVEEYQQPSVPFFTSPEANPASYVAWQTVTQSAFGTEPAEFVNRTEPMDGSTVNGPADKYVIDSPADVTGEVWSQYGEVQDFTFTLWIDRETDVWVKYTAAKTVVTDGETETVRHSFRFRDLGTTTIEEPDWAP